MDVTLIVELIKGGAPAWPRLEHDDAYVVVGSGATAGGRVAGQPGRHGDLAR